MRKILFSVGGVAVAVLVSACTAAPAPVQTVAPAPMVTVTEPTPEPDPVVEDSFGVTMLEIVWDDTPKSSRNDMCLAYDISPSYMWRSFRDGLDDKDVLTRQEFYTFMDEHC